MRHTVANLFALGCANLLAAEASADCKYSAADLIAPKEGPLFGCGSFEECDALGNTTTTFQDFMSFTAVKLAAYAYYAKEGEYEARYKDQEMDDIDTVSEPHYFFDNNENLINFLFNDTMYDNLFDDSEAAKSWLSVGQTRGFHLYKKKSDKSKVLGLSALLKLKKNKSTKQVKSYKATRNVMAIVFRGSTVASDWKDNLDYGITNDIYKGFYGRSQSYSFPIIKRLVKMVKRTKHTIQDVLFAGHSLGGADSMVSPIAIRRALYGKAFNKTYTTEDKKQEVADIINNLNFHTINIGAPKPGNAALIQSFNENLVFHQRIINDFDPVPDVPTKNILYEIREGRCPECEFKHIIPNPIKLEDFYGIEDHGYNAWRPSVYHGSGLYVNRWRQFLELKLNQQCAPVENDIDEMPSIVDMPAEAVPAEEESDDSWSWW